MTVLVLFLENVRCIYTMNPEDFELNILALILEMMAH